SGHIALRSQRRDRQPRSCFARLSEAAQLMGDPACWLDQLCPDCAAMLDAPESGAIAVTCWRCGATVHFGDEGPRVTNRKKLYRLLAVNLPAFAVVKIYLRTPLRRDLTVTAVTRYICCNAVALKATCGISNHPVTGLCLEAFTLPIGESRSTHVFSLSRRPRCGNV